MDLEVKRKAIALSFEEKKKEDRKNWTQILQSTCTCKSLGNYIHI